MVVYIVAREARLQGTARSTWPGWRPHAALRGWPVYLRYALPSVAMLCTEWWTFEILIIFSGWLDDPEMSISAMGLLVSMSGKQEHMNALACVLCAAGRRRACFPDPLAAQRGQRRREPPVRSRLSAESSHPPPYLPHTAYWPALPRPRPDLQAWSLV